MRLSNILMNPSPTPPAKSPPPTSRGPCAPTRRRMEVLQSRPGGRRMQQVLWAASGSEAIQKALWAALARDKERDLIIATRFRFHGKKGLPGAVTGSEQDK